MTAPFPVRFDGAHSAECVEVGDAGDLAAALSALGLPPPRPVVVVVGGAGGLRGSELDRLRPLFSSGLVPVLERLGAAGVDGGTYSGVMRLLGEARAQAAALFPLVGVAARCTVHLPGAPAAADDAAELDPHHTQLLLVPGKEWGDESPWIARVATELAGTAPSVTILVNGGDIAYSDVRRSVEAGRVVLAVAGSGRTANALAEALRGEPADQRAVELAATGLLRAVPADDPAAVAALVTNVLGGSAVN